VSATGGPSGDDPAGEPPGAWRLLGERPLLEGWIKVAERRYQLPDGRIVTWEVETSSDAVGVLALTDDEQVVLVEQFRPGPNRRVRSLPGGIVDPGETPTQAAHRELREETGYTAQSLDVVATAIRGSGTELMHAAVARGCRRTHAQQLDATEDVTVHVVDVADLRAAVRAGQLTAPHMVYLALDHAGLL
jgi:ADP-ribose pyrophosphatase